MDLTTMAVYLAGIIVGGIVFGTVLDGLLDLLIPARLERFKLEQYKEGVQDATPKVEINKG